MTENVTDNTQALETSENINQLNNLAMGNKYQGVNYGLIHNRPRMRYPALLLSTKISDL